MVVRCHVCDAKPAQYRCPSCQVLYCSSRCYKGHQQVHSASFPVPGPEGSSPSKLQSASFGTGVTLRKDTRIGIQHQYFTEPIDLHKDICTITNRHPKFRHQLKQIYNATLEPGDDEQYANRIHPKPRHGKGRGRGSHRPGAVRGCWTPEKGFSQALYRFRKAKERTDDTGEAMRTFSGLVVNRNAQYTPDANSKDQVASGAVTEPSDSDPVLAFLNAL